MVLGAFLLPLLPALHHLDIFLTKSMALKAIPEAWPGWTVSRALTTSEAW